MEVALKLAAEVISVATPDFKMTFTMMGTWTQPPPALNCVCVCVFKAFNLLYYLQSNFCLLYLILVFTVSWPGFSPCWGTEISQAGQHA